MSPRAVPVFWLQYLRGARDVMFCHMHPDPRPGSRSRRVARVTALVSATTLLCPRFRIVLLQHNRHGREWSVFIVVMVVL